MGKKPSLSPEDRLRIIAMSEAGATSCSAARSTVHYAIKRYTNHHTIKDLLRSGWPSKISLREKKIVFQKACAMPKIGYSELAAATTFVNEERTPSKPHLWSKSGVNHTNTSQY